MPKKIRRTFTLNPEIFNNLKVFAARNQIPYSLILEELANTFLKDPTLFPSVSELINKYKNRTLL